MRLRALLVLMDITEPCVHHLARLIAIHALIGLYARLALMAFMGAAVNRPAWQIARAV